VHGAPLQPPALHLRHVLVERAVGDGQRRA
jgi:hypothetical protein